ncbi:MAG TPA: hypothetical protein V6C72_05845, partial [Chroococcales cyanobacterium]
GAFVLKSDAERGNWQLSDPIFLGHIIHHFVHDPRNHDVVVMATKTGHLGPTVFRSTDGGKTFVEAKQPPAFPKVPEGEKGRAVDVVFWVTPGHGSEKGVWYAGTAPPGLFRSEDDGDTWEPVLGFNDHPDYDKWTSIGGTPNGQFLHSINIDPRDASKICIGISVGGVFASDDKGVTWMPFNKGLEADFLPGEADYGHDPHCIVQHPQAPDRFYQQNHCGIYRVDLNGDKAAARWERIGRAMPKEIGDIGFPIVLDPRDADRAWVFPMDGTEVWPRTSPDGKPACYQTKDGGKSWVRQDRGLPEKQAYFTVMRQAMTADSRQSMGIYFGTTAGEIWGSINEGEEWQCLVRYLPEVFSLTVMEG